MKILVPTDFSKSAYNAFKFAVEIAKRNGATIVLHHAYSLPVVYNEAQVTANFLDSIKAESEQQLNEMCEYERKLYAEHSFVIETEMSQGRLIDGIADDIATGRYDLIVMGTTGATGAVQKFFIGSNTAEVMTQSTIPVMAIPESSWYTGFGKIVLATDLKHIPDAASFKILNALAKLFDATVHILTIIPDADNVPDADQSSSVDKFTAIFSGVKHIFSSKVSKDITIGIDEYIDENNADLLVMLPQKHGFFDRLFNKSITKEMAYHVRIPMMGITAK